MTIYPYMYIYHIYIISIYIMKFWEGDISYMVDKLELKRGNLEPDTSPVEGGWSFSPRFFARILGYIPGLVGRFNPF